MPTTAAIDAPAIPTAEELYARARALQPRIAALAPQMERNRQLDGELTAAMDEAGLYSVMVTRNWGGAGLGIAEASEILRIIAQADVCAAWNASFYMLTNVLLSRFPMRAQEHFFASKPSYNCAALMAPAGKVERVEGGYHVTGRWPYASGVHHAEGVLLPSMLDGEPWGFVVPREQVTLEDDWNVAAMAASGSVTVVLDDLFVPEICAAPMTRVSSASDHGGTGHPEWPYHCEFVRLGIISSALAVGALETAMDLGQQRLATSRPMGVPRIERPFSRMRWAEASQTLRMISLLRERAVEDTVANCLRGEWSTEQMGQSWLDKLSIFHGAKDALRVLVDTVGGSSIYKSSEPLQRIQRDIAMICTHLVIADYEVLWERGSRLKLGGELGQGEF